MYIRATTTTTAGSTLDQPLVTPLFLSKDVRQVHGAIPQVKFVLRAQLSADEAFFSMFLNTRYKLRRRMQEIPVEHIHTALLIVGTRYHFVLIRTLFTVQLNPLDFGTAQGSLSLLTSCTALS